MNIFLNIYENGRYGLMLKYALKMSESVGGMVVSIATFHKGLGKCTTNGSSST